MPWMKKTTEEDICIHGRMHFWQSLNQHDKAPFGKSIYRFLLMAFVTVSAIYLCGCGETKSNGTVHIAVLANNLVTDFNANYYTSKIEEATGYDIEFEYIPADYAIEYIDAMLNADKGRIDAVFLPKKQTIISKDRFKDYVDAGFIENLSEYADSSTNVGQLVAMARENKYEWDIFADGALYAMPNIDLNPKRSNMQIMWINLGWLKKLSLQIPETTEDLEKVLKAFKEKDPNGNGTDDELPLVSNESSEAFRSYYFLMNAFCYTDPKETTEGFLKTDMKYRMLESIPKCADESGEAAFEEGLSYCERLIDEGLLCRECAFFSEKQFREVLNSPSDYVGAFTCQSISEAIYPECSDILSNFIQVPPLKGPEGEANAVFSNPKATIGGFIPSNAEAKEASFAIMDYMLSDAGSLIGTYGEEGVDWRYSKKGELSPYGEQATITTINYLSYSITDKNFGGAGPMALSGQYVRDVNWNGNFALNEYLDARAVRLYENYRRIKE